MSLEVILSVLTALGIAGGAGAGYWFSDEQKRKRAVDNAPSRSLAKVSEGELVKVVGQIRYIGEPLQATLTARPCACCEVIVEESGNMVNNRGGEVIRDVRAIDFLLDDDSGRARVDTRAIEIETSRDKQLTNDALGEAKARAEAFLAKHGQSTRWWILERALRYQEGILAPGKMVEVTGVVSFEDDPDPSEAGHGYRDRPKRPVIGPPPEGRVRVRPAPWADGLTAAAREQFLRGG